jgi:N-acetyl sugar amidotransferase
MTPLWSADVEHRLRSEAYSLDPQKTPDHVQQCTRCVVTNQRPRITFDAEGVCSACRFWEHKGETDWAAREHELRDLLDRHRRPSGYDVIVPSSGGKDSAMVAHRLKHDYGMRPLCVKFAPFMYTGIGRRNWEATGDRFDTLEARPAGLFHRKLARLCFEYLGDPFQPFVYGQLAFPMQMARRFSVPLVMFGECGEAYYGGDASAANAPRWDTAEWDRVYTKRHSFADVVAIGLNLGALTPQEAIDASEFYKLPPGLVGTEFHWWSYYRDWWPMQNFYEAVEHMGFEPNPERSEGTYTKMASLDDKLDGLHYKMAHVKFGIGRATSDAAQQIRAGDIDREEGLALVRKYDGEFPVKHLDECLAYLGMDRAQLERVIERFTPAHIARLAA